MKNLKSADIKKYLSNSLKMGNTEQKFTVLKKAWEDLPPDFTEGERSLFIELAERLIRLDPGQTN